MNCWINAYVHALLKSVRHIIVGKRIFLNDVWD